MLATLILAAVLMIAVLQVTARLGRTSQQLAQKQSREPWDDALIALLRCDLEHAQKVEMVGESVIITGHDTIDPVTRLVLHRPGKIVYRIQTAANRSCLVREQKLLDDPDGRSWIEPVGVDVLAIQVSAKLPDRARITLRSSVSSAQSLDRTFIFQ
jgi:hypothetical protein